MRQLWGRSVGPASAPARISPWHDDHRQAQPERETNVDARPSQETLPSARSFILRSFAIARGRTVNGRRVAAPYATKYRQ
jgi:hypothetical protein